MDKLDIFEIEPTVNIQTTISELRALYCRGWNDGAADNMRDDDAGVIEGEIL